MSVLKKPDLTDPKLRAKLAKGMGHNYYGEPAWPNDLLYIFPVVILGTLACVIGLSVLSPSPMGEKADPFATPLEILPEWYFFPTFNLLRIIPNKLLGVLYSRPGNTQSYILLDCFIVYKSSFENIYSLIVCADNPKVVKYWVVWILLHRNINLDLSNP